jgi:hypothetical protein
MFACGGGADLTAKSSLRPIQGSYAHNLSRGLDVIAVPMALEVLDRLHQQGDLDSLSGTAVVDDAVALLDQMGLVRAGSGRRSAELTDPGCALVEAFEAISNRHRRPCVCHGQPDATRRQPT